MYKKPNKTPLRIFIAILVIIAAAGVYLVYQGSSGGGKDGKTGETAETAVSESSVSTEDAPFEHVFPEKMDGLYLVEETYDGKLYTASYSDGENSGFIHKSVESGDNSGVTNSFPEKNEQDVDGLTVTFKGRNGKVNLAVWENNNISYSIGIRVDGEGADPENMIEYVRAIR